MAAMFAWLIAAIAAGTVLLIGLVGLGILAFGRPADGVMTIVAAATLGFGVLFGVATGGEYRYGGGGERAVYSSGIGGAAYAAEGLRLVRIGTSRVSPQRNAASR